MASANQPSGPKKKPGPTPERLVIREEDAEEALDRLLKKPPRPKPKGQDSEEETDGAADRE